MITATFIFNGVKEGVQWQDETFWGTDCVGRLCRRLKEGKLLIYSTKGMPSLHVDVARRAKKSLIESDKKELTTTPYRPFPTPAVR